MKYLFSSPNGKPFQKTWVILAGGGSVRFGKATKALALLKGLSLVQRVVIAGQQQADHVYINVHTGLASNERHESLETSEESKTRALDLKAYQALGVPLLEELPPFHQGPLGGMASAWQQLSDDWLLFSPCDSPFLPTNLYVKLQQALQAGTMPLAVVHDGERMQPLYCLMHRSLLASLQNAITEGQLSVKRWIAGEDHVEVDFSDQASSFVNINTPQDLAKIEGTMLLISKH